AGAAGGAAGEAAAGGPAKPGLPPDFEAVRARDPLRAEALAWKSGGPLPRELLGFQKTSAADAAPSLGEKGGDYGEAGARAGALAREAVFGRRRTTAGALRLSATQLEEYLDCPFAWLLKRGLGLENEATGPGFFDALLAGEMAHAAIGKLFARIAETGPFSSARLESYRSFVHEAVSSVLPEFERKEGPFLLPMFSAYAPLLEDRLARLVEAESWMEGWETGDFERSFEKAYPGLGAILEGRVDRAARSGEGIAIIDYKKRHVPKAKELLADERTGGAPAKLQIAAYVALCESELARVERAAYWSIEDAKRLVVVGPGGLRDREGYTRELEGFETALAAVARGLSEGNFGVAPPGGESCENCGWTAVCRTRYATE
ncbi:MAG: PD-(D/E)XK nuclease family protein, partial [Treponema sp.]|nr:PD-(D/E)XK nuclease family protein [Treponema sp.]